jgi:hypothetical protein
MYGNGDMEGYQESEHTFRIQTSLRFRSAVRADTTALTAIRKLELSQLDPAKIQREMMGDDLDLEKLVVYLKSAILFDTTDRVIDVTVNRTIEGASSVDVELNDYDRAILRSGALNARLDIEIDGLWFRLTAVSRDAGSDSLMLTFEQREIAILRTYPRSNAPHNGVKFALRDKATRAEFILNLLREVKEFKIPVVMPHLHQIQKIEKKTDSSSIDVQGTASTGDSGFRQVMATSREGVGSATPYPTLVTVKGVQSRRIKGTNERDPLTATTWARSGRHGGGAIAGLLFGINLLSSGGDGMRQPSADRHRLGLADHRDPGTEQDVLSDVVVPKDNSTYSQRHLSEFSGVV